MRQVLMVLGVGLLVVLTFSSRPASPRQADVAAQVPVAPTSQPTPDRQAALDVDPRALAADPKTYTGANVIVQGLALNVVQQDDATWISFAAGVVGHPSESMIVILRPRDPRILKGECYRFFAVGAGSSGFRSEGATDIVSRLGGDTGQLPTVNAYASEGAQQAIPGPGCVVPLTKAVG